MEALMPYIATGWLALAFQAALIIQIVSNYIFYRIYLEVIEDYLSNIDLVKKHRDFYGNTHFGRRMREMYLILMIVLPAMYKKHEVIEAWKIHKVPPTLRFWMKVHFYSLLTLLASLTWLYYFRLRLGVR
jgi:hypothetical protein